MKIGILKYDHRMNVRRVGAWLLYSQKQDRGRMTRKKAAALLLEDQTVLPPGNRRRDDQEDRRYTPPRDWTRWSTPEWSLPAS